MSELFRTPFFMHFGGIFVQTQLISHLNKNGGNQYLLKDGSQVLVRIIADKGNGQYEGSVAGARVNLRSSKQLVAGQSFLASISAKNGTVYISPKENQNTINNNQIELNVLRNEQIATVLNQLGLPADELSLHLFQQFKQLGMKIDTDVFQKLRRIALKFSGKEKSAAEILMILNEKKINLTEEQLYSILDILDLEKREMNHNENQNKVEKYEALNKLNQKEGKWYFLPFEIIKTDKNELLGNGNLRLMFIDKTELKLMNVECLYQKERFLFSLQFENRKLKKIMYNFSSDRETSKLEEKIKKINQNIKMEFVDSFMIEGTACASENIISVGGNV